MSVLIMAVGVIAMPPSQGLWGATAGGAAAEL
jgi:hypothetical protein